jgi:hypothetical protein
MIYRAENKPYSTRQLNSLCVKDFWFQSQP